MYYIVEVTELLIQSRKFTFSSIMTDVLVD